MSTKSTEISIINTPASTDLVVSGGVVTVTGLRPFKQSLIKKLKVTRNQQVRPMIYTATVTATNGLLVRIRCQQTVGENPKNLIYEYQFPASGASSTAFAADFAAFMQANFGVTVSNNAGNPTIISTVTGTAATPMFVLANIEGATVALSPATLTLAESDAQVVGTPITMTFSASHNLKTGDYIKLGTVGAGGANATLIANKTWQVQYSAATKITLPDALALATTAVNTGTATVLAIPVIGSPDYVNEVAAENQSSQTATSATDMYDLVEIVGAYDISETTETVEAQFEAQVWIKKNAIASPFTLVTNAANLIAAFKAIEV
jgi:hypothetical protein